MRTARPDYSGALWKPAARTNYTAAARPTSHRITLIVVHVAEGTFSGTYRWFQDKRAKASAHYVVARNGRVAQMVGERDIAWHAGNWAYNAASIGIEHAGYTARGKFTDREYRGSARLAASVVRRYGIPPDRLHVIGHDEVPDPNNPGQYGGASHHHDPGTKWKWKRYMAYIRLYAGVTYRQFAKPAARGSRYRFSVPATAAYDLLGRWPCARGLPRRATLSALTSAGLRSVVVDQAATCGRWWFLGGFRLERGAGTRVVASGSTPTATLAIVGRRLLTPSTRPAGSG